MAEAIESLVALGYRVHTHHPTGGTFFTPPLCLIPAGSFLMGSDPERDPQALAEEQPQHIVTLPAYHIGRYPVTVAEYACALATDAAHLKPPINWEFQRIHPTCPISGLTWYEALDYVRWLSNMTNMPWRLPTEAEWEKAARGPDGRIYPWGDAWDMRCANALLPRSSGSAAILSEEQDTTSVDAHPLGVSPYGLLDMAGNVGEWVSTIEDSQRFAYPYRLDDGRDDITADEWMRVNRGGCWLFPPEDLRAARHLAFHTTDRYDWLIGLRLALDSQGAESSTSLHSTDI